MSILEYTLQDFLEDRKQEQLENEELRLQLEKERKEKDAAIQAERKEKEIALFSLKTIILNMCKDNKSFEEIAQATALDIDMVRKLAGDEGDV